MIYQSRAIVLRTVRYGETSLIVDMYTEQKGHQTLIINGVRKAKSVTPPAYLQLMSLVEIVAYHQDRQKIHRVKEVRLDHAWHSIPFDMRKSAVITCVAEICSKCITTADPHPALFSFLYESLQGYDAPDAYDRDFLIRFLTQLAHHLGFGIDMRDVKPEGQYFDLLEGTVVVQAPAHNYVMAIADFHDLRHLCTSDPAKPLSLPLDTRRRLVDLLILYFQLHVESLKVVNSLRILRELQ